MNEKRYYWLKLEENYFDLKVQKALRRLPSGSDMLICYLKMQLKYLNKGGIIEFQGIYDELSQEIALDIDEEEDLVKMTLSVLMKWKVIEPSEDGLYITEMQERIGSKTDAALRMEKHREKQKELQNCNNVTKLCNKVQKSNSIKEIDIEKEKDIEIEKNNIGTHRFKKPTLEEVKAYCKERNNQVDAERFIDFYESKGWKVGKESMKDWKACVRTWESKENKGWKNKIEPSWMDKEVDKEKATDEEEQEIIDLLSEFKW